MKGTYTGHDAAGERLSGTTPQAYARAMVEEPAQSGWERLFWMLFEETSHPIGLVDEERRWLEVNRGVSRLLGRSRGELLGRHVYDDIAAGDRHEAARQWQEFLRTGEYTGRRRFVSRDGTEVLVLFAARSATIDGRRRAVYVVCDDVPGEFKPEGGPLHDPLTEREREVTAAIALGATSREIAADLVVSVETVRTHVRNAMAKLGARTRAQLVAIALSGDELLPQLPRLEEERAAGPSG